MNNFKQLVSQLKKALLIDLPGERAHQILSPKHRSINTGEYLLQNPDFKKACVMLLIYPLDNVPNLVLIERADKGHHAGQIALPGGKMENDESFSETAIRETYEEIGVSINESDILGHFTRVYIPPSNFLVYPLVAAIENKPVFFLEPLEVKRIIEIPLEAFLKPGVIREREFSNSKSRTILAPYFDVNGIEIWGATAMIISELTYILKNISK